MSERHDALESFLKQAGWADAARAPLPGDASTRRYMRLDRQGSRAMLMDQPQHAEAKTAHAGATPDQRRALGYNAVARLAGADCGRFVAAANHLRARGLTAPEIYAADIPNGFLLIEDLGDDLYADVLNAGGDEPALYAAAVEALVRLHREAAPAELPGGVALHAYDETALIAETDLLTEWFLPLALGRPATPEEVASHRALWREALHRIETPRPVFVHRDYHAQNLLWLPDRSGPARAGLIDFQDAVAGSPAYDLVSLLEDARRDVPPALARAMTAHYLDRAHAAGLPVDEARFRAEAAFYAAQRNAKIVGIFARLAKRDGKPRYLSLLPRVWTHLENDLSHPALANLKAWYDRVLPRDKRQIREMS